MFPKLWSFVLLTVMSSVLFASNTDKIARIIVERVLVLVMNDRTRRNFLAWMRCFHTST
jgi:hypothetical protein